MKQNQERHRSNSVDDMVTTLGLLGIDPESLGSMVDDLPVYLWVHDENHTIVYGNRYFRESFGTCVKQTCHQCLMGKSKPCNCCLSKKSLESDRTERCKLCKRKNSGFDLNIFHTPITNRDGHKYILKSSFHIKDLGILAESFHVQKNTSKEEQIFLVMCSSCNKVKDRNNNWLAIDNCIIDYFNVHISHGICPECSDVLYPGLNKQKKLANITTK